MKQPQSRHGPARNVEATQWFPVLPLKGSGSRNHSPAPWRTCCGQEEVGWGSGGGREWGSFHLALLGIRFSPILNK